MKVIGSDTAITASLCGSIIVAIFSFLNYLGSYATKAEVQLVNVRLAALELRIDRILSKASGWDNGSNDHRRDLLRIDTLSPLLPPPHLPKIPAERPAFTVDRRAN